MATKPKDGALIYVDQQIEALKKQVPAALDAFDAKGIHQSRVATRRLKAAIDLLEPTADKKSLKPLIKTGRKLRKRLGPLRDLDVMIEYLSQLKLPAKYHSAIEWITSQLHQQRTKMRENDAREGKDSLKMLEQFECWWIARKQIEYDLPSIGLILTNALHEQFDTFFQSSERLIVGDVIDVHELRIIGKALRYTFEIAEAHGLKIPKTIFKTFKAMQESLGTWHDFVVLTECTLGRMSKTQIAHHNPDLGALLLEMSRRFTIESGKSLNHFKTQWKRAGEKIKIVLHDKAPLARDVSHVVEWDKSSDQSSSEPTIESQTDHDLSVTATTSPEASGSTIAPKVS